MKLSKQKFTLCDRKWVMTTLVKDTATKLLCSIESKKPTKKNTHTQLFNLSKDMTYQKHPCFFTVAASPVMDKDTKGVTIGGPWPC